MSGHRVRAVAKRVVEQFRHDRRSLALIIVVPLVLLTLIGYLLTPSGSGTKAQPVALVNEDHGPAGALVVDALASAPSLDARKLDAAAADAALRDATVNAVISFPASFSEDILRTQKFGLSVKLEGSDPFVNGNTLGAIQRAAVDSLAAVVARVAGGKTGGVALDVSYLYGGADYSTLDYVAPVLIPFLAFFFVFLLTDVAFLRERASGTLERLLATPLRRGELVAGYILGLSFFAIVQSLVVILYTIFVLNVRYRGNVGSIFVVEVVMILGAVNLGLFLSAFARNEFQAVQFIPLVIVPQVFLSGILFPLRDLPDLLRPIAYVLPLTYANEALRAVMVKGFDLTEAGVLRDLGILLAFAIVVAAGAVATIRREVA